MTLDSEQPGGYSKFPWYALRQNYAEAIIAAGGLPMALPHDPALAAAYLDRIDALVVTGGAFDVDPALYGDGEQHATVTLKAGRTAAELALTQGALARGLPVLGICGGEQLLAVALGGTLIQHIPDAIADALAHEQPNPRHEPGHAVAIVPGTLLHRIVGSDRDAGELVAPSGGARSRPRRHGQRARAGRRDRRHRGQRAALLPRRAVAPGILHRPRRPAHLRCADRRLPDRERRHPRATASPNGWPAPASPAAATPSACWPRARCG